MNPPSPRFPTTTSQASSACRRRAIAGGSERSAVVTGSHNLGYKASYNNDENLAIIRGNKKLAAAYASHVLDVYDHFAWRVQMKNGKPHPDQSLDTDPAKWQSRYFDDKGQIKVAQLKFWLSALA